MTSHSLLLRYTQEISDLEDRIKRQERVVAQHLEGGQRRKVVAAAEEMLGLMRAKLLIRMQTVVAAQEAERLHGLMLKLAAERRSRQ